MKRAICMLISILMLFTYANVFAHATNENVNDNCYSFNISGIEYTVEFITDNLTYEEQKQIAEKLVGINETHTETYGLGCTLFGHDYKYTTANVVTHKARTYAPRCKRQTYDVTYCEDCDYTEQTLNGTAYIYCCPEE